MLPRKKCYVDDGERKKLYKKIMMDFGVELGKIIMMPLVPMSVKVTG